VLISHLGAEAGPSYGIPTRSMNFWPRSDCLPCEASALFAQVVLEIPNVAVLALYRGISTATLSLSRSTVNQDRSVLSDMIEGHIEFEGCLSCRIRTLHREAYSNHGQEVSTASERKINSTRTTDHIDIPCLCGLHLRYNAVYSVSSKQPF
jgi:hypothetical protein